MSVLQLAGLPGYEHPVVRNRVLLVEDDPFWKQMYDRCFHRLNRQIDVLSVNSADEGISAIFEQGPFDMIIADHLLGGSKTGLDLWDQLIELRTSAAVLVPDTSFVLMSGMSQAELLSGLMPYRVEMIPQFVQKPSSVGELTKCLKRLLDQRQISDVHAYYSKKAGRRSV